VAIGQTIGRCDAINQRPLGGGDTTLQLSLSRTQSLNPVFGPYDVAVTFRTIFQLTRLASNLAEMLAVALQDTNFYVKTKMYYNFGLNAKA
jgi:hypothetical protein